MNASVNNSACSKVARSTDLIFLKSILDTTDTALRSTAIQEDGEYADDLPVTHDSLRLADQVKTIAEQRVYLDEAKELFSLLTDKWIQGLLEVHDEVAAHIQNSLEEVKYIDGVSSGEQSDEEGDKEGEEAGGEEKEKSESSEEIVDTFRVVGLRRRKGESLGLTVSVDDHGKVIVARILSDSYIESQGLLRPGDIILEANGTRVTDPEQLQTCIEESVEFINLKIQPTLALSQSNRSVSLEKAARSGKFFIRALYSYEPKKDTLLPCPEIGLGFKYGDILEVVCSQDPSWWQARLEGEDTIGLIPSLDLEERRKCFVDKDDLKKRFSCCGSGKKEKKRFSYHFRKNADMDEADLQLYEAVERMPPFTRKSLVVVGPPGVGRRSLITKIVSSDTKLFDCSKAVTSRPRGSYETDGERFWFVTEDEIMTSIDRDEFLEVVDQDGYLYGTTYQSIRTIISQGKLCLITCKPETLKILHQSSELLPYVVFLSAPSLARMRDLVNSNLSNHHNNVNGDSHKIHSNPCLVRSMKTEQFIGKPDFTSGQEEELVRCVEESLRIREEYQQYFDLEVPMDNFDAAYSTILQAVNKLSTESQWVPLNWVYS